VKLVGFLLDVVAVETPAAAAAAIAPAVTVIAVVVVAMNVAAAVHMVVHVAAESRWVIMQQHTIHTT
jgi:hypothetical protein